jgi:predicted dehydrogenase
VNAESRLAWGIMGTGNIARKFAEAVKTSSTGVLVAVGSRAQATAETFGDSFGIPKRYDSYAAVLADPAVQAVYISMPNQLHAEWAIKAAEAGKHILCEKPLALNHAEAMAIVEAAQTHKVFLMEAFMYRCHPLMAKLSELLKAKVIGELRIIQANFCFNMGEKFDNIRLQNDCGGGGIMDLGQPAGGGRRARRQPD